MSILRQISSLSVAAFLLALTFASTLTAQTMILDRLFTQLQTAIGADTQALEREIIQEWSKSGSDSMDLLLERGRRAMSADQHPIAVDYFSTLIDHAPDFAEGYNARATAYFHMGQLGLSVSDIQTTLALNPRHFGAMSGLGMIFERLERPRSALIAYQEVLKIHPNREDAQAAVERLEQEVGGTAL